MWLIFLQEAENKLKQIGREISDLGDFIAPMVQNDLIMLRANLGLLIDHCNKVKNTGECDSFPLFC